MIPEDVRKHQMLNSQKRLLRAKAEGKKKEADEKFKLGDHKGAKMDLIDARHYIQNALQKVRQMGERGSSERTIQDEIETLWRKILSEE